MLKILYLLLLSCFMSSCMLDESVDILIEESQKEVLVEAYLYPGGIYEMLLTETTPIDDQLILNLLWRSDVNIYSDTKKIHLSNILYQYKDNKYSFNYASTGKYKAY